MKWHIVTGEFPPQNGGVGDYTANVVKSLAERGEECTVWCPGTASEEKRDGYRIVHLSGGFRMTRMGPLSAALTSARQSSVLLLQYTPNALGMRGCNVPFCLWLWYLAWLRGVDVRVMFHEPFFYFSRQSFKWNVLAFVHRIMAMLLLNAARAVYLSTPAWEPLLKPFALSRRVPFICLPIPATIEINKAPEAVMSQRERWLKQAGATQIVGHFGTYGAHVRDVLAPCIGPILDRNPNAAIALLGMNGGRFAEGLVKLTHSQRARLIVTGSLEPEALSIAIQACDLFLQPFPDGVTTRRTSAMTPLAHGKAVVTSSGTYTEQVWKAARIPLAPAADSTAHVDLVSALLVNPDRATGAAAACEKLYRDHFSSTVSIERLMQNPAT